MSISSSPGSAKPSYHHGNLRAALLDAARGLVAEAGIDGFGLREVSRRAGVSHSAAYNHFANRSALVEALVVEAFAALADALEAAGTSRDEPLERLRAIGIAYVLFAFDRPHEFRFMFRPELCGDGPARKPERPELAGRAAYAALENAIAACLAAGLARGDAQTLALTAWSTVHGLASLVVDGPLRTECPTRAAIEALARNVTATLERGLAD